MLYIAPHITLPENELSFTAVRAQGAGGQNVNKVSSAIHLRFDINASSLPDDIKQRLLSLQDQRITKEGVIVIKAQEFRHQEKNRTEALRRLKALIQGVTVKPKARIPTKASRSAQQARMETKARRGDIKRLRGKVTD